MTSTLTRRTSRVLLMAISALLLCALPQQSSFADSPSIDCASNLNSYLAARNAYVAANKPSGKDFKDLTALFQNAQKERAACLKAINTTFNEQLQSIKDKYGAMSAASKKKAGAAIRTQRDSEIATATLNRDVAIKSLPSIPDLPPRGKK